MNEQLSRRKFIKAAVGAATVIGFNLHTRSWVTQAQAATQPFAGVPKLDGVLLFDEASRKAIAVDSGNLFHRVPAAVLRPGSVQDVIKMVQYANQHSLKVAIKGQGHSRYGQTQAEAGIVIDSSTLNAVQAPATESVDAQAGALWGQVVGVTLGKGLTPPVLLDFMGLAVGGTLNAGGLGDTSQHYGAQVDNVTELDVVTGDGRFVTCSADRDSELFNMVLAGLGQCGIIVRARIRLVPAPSHVLLHNLIYDDLEKYIADQAQLAMDGRFDHQYGNVIRKMDGTWSFIMQVGKFFTPPAEPNLTLLESGLRFDSAVAPVRMTYLDYLYRNAARWAAAVSSGRASRPSPAIAMWIPASATKDYVAAILSLPPNLSTFDGFSLWPLNTRRFTRPLLKVPNENQMFSLWLFRSAPVGDQAALSALLASNRELLAKMTAVGGKRYGPYSMVISPAEWEAHFGPDVWRRLSEAKKKFDSNHVLSPEPAMFGGRKQAGDA